MMTTKQAAKRLGISTRRITALIISGRLDATKLGHIWVITDEALDTIRHGKPGRPRKDVTVSTERPAVPAEKKPSQF